MKKIFIALFLFVLPGICLAQWHDASGNLPEWSLAWSIEAVDYNSAIISINASDNIESIFITENAGENWRSLGWPQTVGTFKTAIDISAVDKNNIWLAVDNGTIVHTSDGGENWEIQFEDPSLTVFMNYIEMFDSQNGIAMGDGITTDDPAVFLKTTNGGSTWISINDYAFGPYSGDTWRRLDFVNTEVGYFYESGQNPQAMYKTTDGCENWTKLTSYTSNCTILKFYDEQRGISVNVNGGVFNTFDGGESWDPAETNPTGWGNDVEFLPDNPDGVLFTSSAGLFYSISGGMDWIKDESFPEDFYGRDIDFAQTNSCWLIGDKGYLFRSTNAGGIILSVDEENNPKEFKLSQNYPNPFNPTTTIEYTIPVGGENLLSQQSVKVIVYDILGKQVAELVNQKQSPENYRITFDASGFSSGIYFYQLSTGEFKQTKKMILLR